MLHSPTPSRRGSVAHTVAQSLGGAGNLLGAAGHPLFTAAPREHASGRRSIFSGGAAPTPQGHSDFLRLLNTGQPIDSDRFSALLKESNKEADENDGADSDNDDFQSFVDALRDKINDFEDELVTLCEESFQHDKEVNGRRNKAIVDLQKENRRLRRSLKELSPSPSLEQLVKDDILPPSSSKASKRNMKGSFKSKGAHSDDSLDFSPIISAAPGSVAEVPSSAKRRKETITITRPPSATRGRIGSSPGNSPSSRKHSAGGESAGEALLNAAVAATVDSSGRSARSSAAPADRNSPRNSAAGSGSLVHGATCGGSDSRSSTAGGGNRSVRDSSGGTDATGSVRIGVGRSFAEDEALGCSVASEDRGSTGSTHTHASHMDLSGSIEEGQEDENDEANIYVKRHRSSSASEGGCEQGSQQLRGLNGIRAKDAAGGAVEDGEYEEESEAEQVSESDREPFVLLPAWKSWKGARNKKALSFLAKKPGHLAQVLLENQISSAPKSLEIHAADVRSRVHRLWAMCMIPHTSRCRTGWDLCSAVLLTYMCIYTPLEMFELPQTTFAWAFSWASRLFWTIDIFLMFCTTFENTGGRIENNPRLVAQHYLRTWFAIDMVLVCLDWSDVFARARDAQKIGNFLKVFRHFRLLRVVRVLSSDSISVFAFLPRSELLEISMTILKTFMCVIFMNHFIACLWYGLGTFNNIGNSWISNHQLVGASLWARYITSYHWSLTNFHASADIDPTNINERAFTVFAVFFAFFAASVVVSNMTSAMTRLEIIRTAESARLNLLRQFLVDNSISNQLAYRITKHAKSKISHEKRNLPEASVDLLGIISEPLQQELHMEMHLPMLSGHPFFCVMCKRCPNLVRKICHTAITRSTCMSGDIVFVENEVHLAPKMFFVVSGRLAYLQRAKEVKPMWRPSWACEAVLWTKWTTVGALMAAEDSSLIAIDSYDFQRICTSDSEVDSGFIKSYAKCYCDELNGLPDDLCTDLDHPQMGLKSWCARLEGDEVCDSAHLRAAFAKKLGMSRSTLQLRTEP